MALMTVYVLNGDRSMTRALTLPMQTRRAYWLHGHHVGGVGFNGRSELSSLSSFGRLLTRFRIVHFWCKPVISHDLRRVDLSTLR